MDITIAYFHPLLRPDVVKQDFEQIRSAGANSILYTFHEQEDQRAPRDFERGLQQAQDAGLKINLSLGRFGNLFAGPALVPSWYTFRHLQSRVMDQHGRYHESTCFNHQAFRSWISREIARCLASYPINGILFDEPGGLDVTCYCPACRALCPDVTDLSRFRRRSMIAFLGDLCTQVKQLDKHVKTTIVLRPQDLSLVEDLVAIDSLDAVGCHLFWNILREHVTRVGQWGRELVDMTRQAGKCSQLWLQNFNVDARVEEEMEEAFTQILALEPDELGCYYFWRNNENPARAWESTRRLLRRVPRRQMRWRAPMPTPSTTPPTPFRFPVALPSKPTTAERSKLTILAATLLAAETVSLDNAASIHPHESEEPPASEPIGDADSAQSAETAPVEASESTGLKPAEAASNDLAALEELASSAQAKSAEASSREEATGHINAISQEERTAADAGSVDEVKTDDDETVDKLKEQTEE
jgi:hypothetical protein